MSGQMFEYGTGQSISCDISIGREDLDVDDVTPRG